MPYKDYKKRLQCNKEWKRENVPRKTNKRWGKNIHTSENSRKLRRDRWKRYSGSPKGIYASLKSNPKKSVGITQKDFIDWYNITEKKCFYCGINEEDWGICGDSLTKRTKRLTIDRLKPKESYNKNNIVFSCFRCNLIKSDFFTPKEMKELAKKYVKTKWNKNG